MTVGMRAGWRAKLARAGAFLEIAAATITAPLNPACKTAEFNFYPSELKPKAGRLRNAGPRGRGRIRIPVIELHPEAADRPEASASMSPPPRRTA